MRGQSQKGYPKNCLALIKRKKANFKKMEGFGYQKGDRVIKYQTNRVCQRRLSYGYELGHMVGGLNVLPSL
jgi:hypothetical protein